MILKDDLQGSYIPIEAHGYLKGVCQEILPMGFTSLLSAVYKYTHILICFYRKRKRSNFFCLSTFFASCPPGILLFFEKYSKLLLADLQCILFRIEATWDCFAVEKRAKLTNWYILHSLLIEIKWQLFIA